jgi:hypothetical protein
MRDENRLSIFGDIENKLEKLIEHKLNDLRSEILSAPSSDFVPKIKWSEDHDISLSKINKLIREGEISSYNFGKNVFLKRSEMEDKFRKAS